MNNMIVCIRMNVMIVYIYINIVPSLGTLAMTTIQTIRNTTSKNDSKTVPRGFSGQVAARKSIFCSV